MRRQDRQMPEEFALSIADKCEYAVLATVNADGTPYCVPISIVRDGQYLYLHCAKDGQKIDNMRLRPDVCLTCVGDIRIPSGQFTTEYESAVITGRADEVTGDEEKIHALRLLSTRYTKDNMGQFDAAIARSLVRTAVWKIGIETVSGKRKKYDKDGKEMKFGRME